MLHNVLDKVPGYLDHMLMRSRKCHDDVTLQTMLQISLCFDVVINVPDNLAHFGVGQLGLLQDGLEGVAHDSRSVSVVRESQVAIDDATYGALDLGRVTVIR